MPRPDKTAHSYIVTHEPELMEITHNPTTLVLDIQEDARRVAARLGIMPLTGKAPRFMQDAGVMGLDLFPAVVWDHVYHN